MDPATESIPQVPVPGSSKKFKLKEHRESEFRKNVVVFLTSIFSRLDLSFIKGKSRIVEEGPTEKELQLGGEKEALRA